MADETTPVPPVEPPAASQFPPPVLGAPVEAAKKRAIWPWVLGGSILLFFGLVAGLAVLVITLLGSAASPTRTVTDFDQAFAKVDCDLFESTTTPAFRDSFLGEAFSCAPWEQNAQGLQVDGEYAYSVVIKSSSISGDTATVSTTEVDSASAETPTTYELSYTLVKTNGRWLIDSITDR